MQDAATVFASPWCDFECFDNQIDSLAVHYTVLQVCGSRSHDRSQKKILEKHFR
jgi:hypothetical protein